MRARTRAKQSDPEENALLPSLVRMDCGKWGGCWQKAAERSAGRK
ncbi:MAG: hypothetical protein Q4E91_11740 [Lachnospiraceae bacterium]|nr:hypothetical protein [Lachnospiraceae bacterium]